MPIHRCCSFYHIIIIIVIIVPNVSIYSLMCVYIYVFMFCGQSKTQPFSSSTMYLYICFIHFINSYLSIYLYIVYIYEYMLLYELASNNIKLSKKGHEITYVKILKIDRWIDTRHLIHAMLCRINGINDMKCHITYPFIPLSVPYGRWKELELENPVCAVLLLYISLLHSWLIYADWLPFFAYSCCFLYSNSNSAVQQCACTRPIAWYQLCYIRNGPQFSLRVSKWNKMLKIATLRVMWCRKNSTYHTHTYIHGFGRWRWSSLK